MNETIIKTQSNHIKILIGIVLILVLFILVSWSELSSYKITKTCDDESSYEEAKKDMVQFPNLDKDKNGRPCESQFPLQAIEDTKVKELPI